MSALDDFVNGLIGSQNNPLTQANSNEFDGNVNDLLFSTDQVASALTVSGGTTFTSISPTTAITDLGSGKISLAVLVWIAIVGVAAWWFLKR